LKNQVLFIWCDACECLDVCLDVQSGVVFLNFQSDGKDLRPALAIEVQGPDTAALGVAWRAALATVPGADAFPELSRELAATFLLDAAGVESVGIELVAGYTGSLQEAAWDAARRRARADIEPLAERVASRATWSDLVLPPEPTALLEELVSHFRHRVRVHDDWGLSAHGSRGDGVVALFSGPSGVGKSLAAEVVANTLALDLWRVDLASLVSKYIGETEKNLGRVFDAAERGACVLLFDEADALFGKRTEVRDSHDRHANLEVSYLLQRLERYRGIAILTTNLRANVDVAFQRRFRLSVEFPFPGPAERVRMWARVFPPATPTRGLDPERLAQLNVSGALIRNIALRAAFVAASEGGPVTMAHVARAARADYQQREQRMSKAEAAGWAD
jgi:SpoVK/Ycf46/Vps4 family AAA+-type ATPase